MKIAKGDDTYPRGWTCDCTGGSGTPSAKIMLDAPQTAISNSVAVCFLTTVEWDTGSFLDAANGAITIPAGPNRSYTYWCRVDFRASSSPPTLGYVKISANHTDGVGDLETISWEEIADQNGASVFRTASVMFSTEEASPPIYLEVWNRTDVSIVVRNTVTAHGIVDHGPI